MTSVVVGSAMIANGGAASRPVLGKAFTAKVIALCERALAQKRAEPPFPASDFNPTKPDISKLPTIGHYEAAGVRIFRTWLGRMLALGPPPQGRDAWAALIVALRAHTRIIAHQQAAALRRDAAAFTHDFYAGNEVQRQTVRAAAAAGVPVCATAAGA
jgi:hypothetical protein